MSEVVLLSRGIHWASPWQSERVAAWVIISSDGLSESLTVFFARDPFSAEQSDLLSGALNVVSSEYLNAYVSDALNVMGA